MSDFTYTYAGANTPSGFFSVFDDIITSSRRCRIIKGCPGGGKSTFIRSIAQGLQAQGHHVELLRCASDPASLDGFVCRELSLAYVDGTPPHSIEARYPGAMETYVDLGQFMDENAIATSSDGIKELYDRYEASKVPAFQCLKAAKELEDIILSDVVMITDFEKLGKRCDSMIHRELGKKRCHSGTASRRFTSSISHEGYISDLSLCQSMRVYALETAYGLNRFITQRILFTALEQGLDVVACLDVMEPLGSPAHAIIPELELAFATSSPRHPYMYEPYRRVHLDSAIDKARLVKLRRNLRFNRKTADSLIDKAVQYFSVSYGLHQELEAAYKPYIDFSGVTELCDRHLKELTS